jgi:hypothetical protein
VPAIDERPDDLGRSHVGRLGLAVSLAAGVTASKLSPALAVGVPMAARHWGAPRVSGRRRGVGTP